jgi:hypothetical protein
VIISERRSCAVANLKRLKAVGGIECQYLQLDYKAALQSVP